MPNPATCDKCGQESNTYTVTFDAKEAKTFTECATCSGKQLNEFKALPVEARKLWMGPEFAPNEYEKVGDTYHLKPEYAAEIEQRMSLSQEELDKEDPSYQEMVAFKRKFRRTEPSTPEEIHAIVTAYREREAEFYARQKAIDAGLWFPDEG